MAPIKSSLSRSISKLLSVGKNRDLSLRGNVQSIRLPPTESSGGTKSTFNNKFIHAFTSPGTLTVSGGAGSYNIEYVVVAGGGAGGRHNGGGGGGAGGYRTGSHTVTGPVSVTVGAGGESNSPNTDYPSNDGANSSITGPGSLSITSEGGGGGGDSDTPDLANANGHAGGSGGGAGSRSTDSGSAGPGNNPPTSPPQGNNGAGNAGSDNSAYREGSGGGGAGGAGGAAVLTNSPYRGGHGGLGVQAPSTFRDPSTPYGAPGPNSEGFWFAGGGAGGSYANPNQALGKGGAEGVSGGPYAGGADGGRGATHGTGGGGGGADNSASGPEASKVGGRGGNGIVLIAIG